MTLTDNFKKEAAFTLEGYISHLKRTNFKELLGVKKIGKYDFAAINHTVLEFKVEDNNLVLYQDDEKLAILFAESDNVFFENPKSRDSFEFKKDSTHKLVYYYKGMTLEAVRIMYTQE